MTDNTNKYLDRNMYLTEAIQNEIIKMRHGDPPDFTVKPLMK